MEQLPNLSREYLNFLFNEIGDTIIYISSQDLEEPGNILDNLILQRKLIKEELARR